MFENLHLILPEVSFDGPVQMAIDEVLLHTVTHPTLRIYRWQGVWVTFGYFQRISMVNQAFPHFSIVRRWTGGGMVKHDHDFTFSLIIPKHASAARLKPSLLYREVHEKIAHWLSNTLAQAIHIADGLDPHGEICFVAPSKSDLLIEDRKILGGAQRRSNGALLYQGSLQGIDFSLIKGEGLARALSLYPAILRLHEDIKKRAIHLSIERYSSLDWNEKC